MGFPPAEGVRVNWEALPKRIRTGIEGICGSPVMRARSQPGGFSPGVAARLACADGTQWFVKAVSSEANADSPGLHRREAEVLRALDPLIAAGRLPAPRLRGALDEGPWTALVLDDIEGRQPEVPWRPGDLAAVLSAVDLLADVLTPSPIEAPGVEQMFGVEFTGWQALAAGPGLSRADSWARENIEQLVRLEQAWPALAAGDTLLHADIRADNVLLTSARDSSGSAAVAGTDRVMIVDWPCACRGAAFIDAAFFAPSVAMQGGPSPDELMAMTRVGRAADREAVTSTVCAIAGYLTERSLRPPPPGIPTVREFQAAQGKIAINWLAGLL
jgi:aminoglycoside phosphotransferase (APT) family kinase protein